FETDMETVVRAGLECIPQGSQYYECVNDVLTWYGANPNWEDTWQLINNKYHLDPNYRRFSCDTGAFNIDAKINGAYVVMGLLYGQGDPNDTITISMRCGQDSDCNPSSAAGILFTSMGYSNVPSRFKSALNWVCVKILPGRSFCKQAAASGKTRATQGRRFSLYRCRRRYRALFCKAGTPVPL
ncbi:MAG: ADP-ribosylglycohydrolase family protein, partial [Planctomycetota bacterium]